MKKIYWRPQGTPLLGFIVIGLFSVGGFLAVEHFQINKRGPYYQEKLYASNLDLQAMIAIKEARLQRGMGIDPQFDPANSGLIGTNLSPVTSDVGDLGAKQTSLNPNFAAVVVDLLKQTGVKEGDRVAVSLSGSLPALNIAAFAAIKVLNLKPTIISSVASSQWGANEPGLFWIDMERLLYEKGIFPFHSVAASFGGRHDTGSEMSEEGRQAIIQAMERNGLMRIEAGSRHENIDQRMSIYFRDGGPKAYINVGGAVTAIGARRRWSGFLKPGLLPSEPPRAKRGDFVVYRFLKAGIPVIHLEQVRQLAVEYGLPIAPETMPKVGEGGVYHEKKYNVWLAFAVLVGIFIGLYIFSRTDAGFRMLQVTSHQEESGPPEPMA